VRPPPPPLLRERGGPAWPPLPPGARPPLLEVDPPEPCAAAQGRPIGATRRCSRLTCRSHLCYQAPRSGRRCSRSRPARRIGPQPAYNPSRGRRPTVRICSSTRPNGRIRACVRTHRWKPCVNLDADQSFICASGRGLCWRWSHRVLCTPKT
jgi:hypothetical protein